MTKEKQVKCSHKIDINKYCVMCDVFKKENCPHYINSDKEHNPNGYMYCTQCKKI